MIKNMMDLYSLLKYLENERNYSQMNFYKVYDQDLFSDLDNKDLKELLNKLSDIAHIDIYLTGKQNISHEYYQLKLVKFKGEKVWILDGLSRIIFCYIFNHFMKEAIQFVEALESFKKRRDGYLYFESREDYLNWRKDLIEKESEKFEDFIYFLTTSHEGLITSPEDIVYLDKIDIDNLINNKDQFDFKKMDNYFQDHN